MNILNQAKFFNAIPPAVIKDNAAFASNVIDKLDVPQGAKGVLFVVLLGALDAALAALKVQQSDTETDATTLGGVPEDVVDVTTKPGATDDNKVWLIYVPMSKWTEQYLQLQATAGDGAAGSYLAAAAIFDCPGETAVDATVLGAGNVQIA